MKIIIMYIITFILILEALLDLEPLFLTWISRIHIGRYFEIKEWEKALCTVAIKFLNRTPKVKVTDNTRFTIIERLKGNYTNLSIQYWQEAALILGLSEKIKNYYNSNLMGDIEKIVKVKLNENGEWKVKPKTVDCAILSYAFMGIDELNMNLYKPALDYTWKLIKENIGEDGTIMYRKSMKKYRYVDTIGLVCPFLVKYGITFDKNQCVDLAIKQISSFQKYGLDEASNFPFHAYNIEKKYKLGLCGWGRGLGWYALGIIDVWNSLPENNEYREILSPILIKLSKSITEVQLNNGGFGWMVTRPETRVDSSTTTLLLWFLINVYNIKEINLKYHENCEKAIKYLMSVTRRNGTIDYSQGDTKDIGVYSQQFDRMPFTQGMALRSISLYLKGEDNE